MTLESKTRRRLGRHKELAAALALALGMGAAGAVAAPSALSAPDHTAASSQQVLHRERVSGQDLQTHAALMSSNNTTAQNWGVTSCADSGPGTLRKAVEVMSDGDTVDLTGLSCPEIKLNSSIVTKTSTHDLTIKSDTLPVINGQHNDSVFVHVGHGTLRLEHVMLLNGDYNGLGGCIWSEGNVELVDTTVKYCSASSGAGVYARGDVTLTSSTVRDNNATGSGAGIYSEGAVSLSDGSIVSGNVADGDEPLMTGGGIHADSTVTTNGSTIKSNKLINSGGDARGGGVYAGDYALIQSSTISGNSVEGPGGSAAGGGMYAANGALVKYGTVNNNSSTWVSGGIHAANGIDLNTVTLSGNHADVNGSAMEANGDVTIAGSTISNNKGLRAAVRLGDGSPTMPVSITQSTISGNESTNSKIGAGLFLVYDALITNSTITGNIERNSSDTKYGAGIAANDGVNVELSSTIVGGNFIEKSGATMVASDLGVAQGTSGVTVTGDHNLITTFTNIPSVPQDTIVLKASNLGPLADNGGPTKTHEPCRNSIAIDNGAINNSATTDQRGSGFPRLMGFNVEIGAIEAPDYSDILFRNGFEKGACGS